MLYFLLLLPLLNSCSKLSHTSVNRYKVKNISGPESKIFGALQYAKDASAFKILEEQIKRYGNEIKMRKENLKGKTFLYYAKKRSLNKCIEYINKEIKRRINEKESIV